jgi:hypothetical protein
LLSRLSSMSCLRPSCLPACLPCVLTQVFDAQSAVDLVAALLAEGKAAKAVTHSVVTQAVRERRCKDNVTLMLVVLGHQ